MMNMTNSETKRAQKKVNDGLYKIGLKYWEYIPVFEIDSLLIENGFDATEAGLYCGESGRSEEQVGIHKYLHLTWHKMESGRFEIVAYLN